MRCHVPQTIAEVRRCRRSYPPPESVEDSRNVRDHWWNTVSLTQPQVIRTLVFNVLTTYHPAMEESKTSWMRSAYIQQRHFDRCEGGTVFVNATLAVSQSNRLDGMCNGIGLSRGSIVRILIRNLLTSTKPAKQKTHSWY
jgi:hypothetical protein